MDNEREFQGQGNEANMSASKTCNAAPNEESQRGGQRSGLDVATTRPQTELNQAAEIGVSLPKADTAGHQTAVESRQSGAARSRSAQSLRHRQATRQPEPATLSGKLPVAITALHYRLVRNCRRGSTRDHGHRLLTRMGEPQTIPIQRA
jgi:hypothetical protein